MSQHCNLPKTLNEGMIAMQKLKLKPRRTIRNANVNFCEEEITAFGDKQSWTLNSAISAVNIS